MTSEQILMIAAMAIYLLGMVYIGIRTSRSTKNTDDFYLGGRKLGPVVTAMSAEASDMSGWLLMGLPGVAYFTGLADPFWTAAGLAIGTWANWFLVARRLRCYSEELGAVTLPDFFHKRFGGSGKSLLTLAAVIIVVFFIPYTASGFAACGKLFSNLFAIDYHAAMIVGAMVIAAYTMTGGFTAASTTDLIQSFVMSGALIFVLCFGVQTAGGIDAVVSNASSIAGYLDLTKMANVASNATSAYGPLTIFSTLSWGLGYFGMPHVLLRFMAIRDDSKLKISRRIATVWVVISMAVAVLIGIIGYTMSVAGAIPFFSSASSAENLIVQVADLLSRNGVLFALLAGVILSGILASTMSTADSQLLAAASSVSENLMDGVLGIKLDGKKKLTVARITVACISVLGVFLAWDPNSSVFQIVSFAWAGFGAAFSPVMLCALFWRRTTRQGALAGMLAGGAMVFIWEYVVTPFGAANGIAALTIYELMPAFLTAIAAIVIVSLLTAKPEQAVTDSFDKMKGIL